MSGSSQESKQFKTDIGESTMLKLSRVTHSTSSDAIADNDEEPKNPENVDISLENFEYTESAEKNLMFEICRVCANKNDHIIPIFEGEGAEHELINKIHKYLPIRVSVNDTLPLQLCYHCAATLLAWHELIEGCEDAEKRLLRMESELREKERLRLKDVTEGTNAMSEEFVDDPEPITRQKEEETCSMGKEKEPGETEECAPGPEGKERCAGIKEMESVAATGEARIIEPRRDATYRTKKSSPRAKRTPEQSDELIRSKVNCNGTTYYKCRDCDKVFTTSYNFLTHRNRHTGEKPFTCHVCGKNFRHGSVLNRHLRDVHAGSKDFPCDLCDRRLASRSARDEHRRTHTGERPHVCETCGKSFKQRASLHVHKRFSHTEAKYAHPCEICERAFQRKQELEKHLLIHTGQKPHVCTICEKRFRTIGCLSRHGKTHSDLKIHACERCGMKFGQQRYLKNHARNVHGTTNHAAARLPT